MISTSRLSKGSRAVLLLGLVVFWTAACATFQGTLGPVQPDPSAQGPKIPLRVSLVMDEALRSQRLKYGDVFEIALNPGLSDAIKGALSTLFEQVSVVDSAQQARDADFVVLPSAEIQSQQPMKLVLVFHDPNALPPVSRYETWQQMDWKSVAAAYVSPEGFALFMLTLGLAAPLVESHDREAAGKKAIEVVGAALSKGLQAISTQIRNDQTKLVAHAKGEPAPGAGAAARRRAAPGPSVTVSYPTEGARVSEEAITVVGVASAPSRISRVDILVNGKPLPTSRDVRVQEASARSQPFSAEVQLRPGHNVIAVTAVDADGQAAQAIRSVYRDLVQAATAAPATIGSGERWVVVIGIDQYRDPSIAPLRYASADAEAVFRFLTTRGGVKPGNARLLLNRQATQRAIREVLGDFLRQKALKDDEVIIYYAGHGTTEPDASAEGGLAKYLVPWDADPDKLFSSAIPMEEVDRVFGRVAARKILLIQDTCFSGGAGGRTFLARGLTTRGTTLTDRFLQELSQKGGRMILTASDVNQVSQEDPALGHGIFTYVLLEGLKGAADLDGDGAITVREAHLYLQRKVHERSRGVQTPQLYNIGDMVLVRTPNR